MASTLNNMSSRADPDPNELPMRMKKIRQNHAYVFGEGSQQLSSVAYAAAASSTALLFGRRLQPAEGPWVNE